jgi:hypothetical protein
MIMTKVGYPSVILFLYSMVRRWVRDMRNMIDPNSKENNNPEERVENKETSSHSKRKPIFLYRDLVLGGGGGGGVFMLVILI